MTHGRVAIVGAGRVGQSLARALTRCGVEVAVAGRSDPVATHIPGTPIADWRAATHGATLIVIAVPDDAVAGVAAGLAAVGSIDSSHVVLHTSGTHDHAVLASLAPAGAALGSWHPLQSFTDRDGDPDAFTGVAVIVEGSPRAIAAGHALAATLGISPVVELAEGAKALYHAGAVFASNYLVVLADIATRLARAAGARDATPALFVPIMRHVVENLAKGSAADALSGPIRRGDRGTVAAHLGALQGDERTLYRLLGNEASRLAAEAGLPDEKVAAIRSELATDRSS